MIDGFLKKFGTILYGATVGLLQQYKKTTLDLAKIEIAAYYVRAIKIIRQEVMISILIIFGVIIFANVLGVVQMAILLYAPWGVPLKITAALVFAVTCSLVPLAVVLRFFSEKRWMEITKADEIVAKAMDRSNTE
jgi:hypothetical protein